MSDAYLSFITGYLNAFRRDLPAPDNDRVYTENLSFPTRRENKPCAMLFSPHPDDECLTGAFPLRLAKEAGWQIINVAVTLGSKAERKMPRKRELIAACSILDFDLLVPNGEVFSEVRGNTSKLFPNEWETMVQEVVRWLKLFRPQAVFAPHSCDWNTAHIGTNMLIMDALAKMPRDFSCAVAQTEYWHPNDSPNLMVGICPEHAALLLRALRSHIGEVARNPYDRRLPAYLIDNARRGGERLAEQGAKAPNIDFAMLYRLDTWHDGQMEDNGVKRILGADAHIMDAFI